ncbi:putative Antigenic cell wall galactomannoprotein-like protein [Seiridium unicorne]|uniref:Antigenic cell wall galactomannoprotein-like protein n=1 Tax=Seiridium unicorne TaxID=138068 RepID=A0ABR2V4I5_9PEZI
MNLSYALLSLVSLVGTAIADGAEIVAALDTISADTASLNDTVASWSGDLLGALPITVKSTSLLADINKATDTAEKSDTLSDIDTFTVAVTTADLIKDTNSTLAEIVATKPKFDKLLLSPVIYLTLSSQKDASGKLSAAIADKVPSTFKSAAEALGAQLDAAFDAALDAYSLF